MRPRQRFFAPHQSRGRGLQVLPLAIASFIALASALPAGAAWQIDGVPITPMPTALQLNALRGLCADGANGAFVVWENQDTDPYDYYNYFSWRAQRVDASGNRPAPWMPSGASILTWSDYNTYGTYNLTPVRLCESGSGASVIAAIDYSFLAEYVTLFRMFTIGSTGTVTPVQIDNTGTGGYAVIAADADGDGSGGLVMIGLQQTFAPPLEPRPPSALYAQRINSSGATQWTDGSGQPWIQLNTAGQTAPGGLAALADGAGGGFFAWIDLREAGDPDLYVQHIDAAGAIASGWPAGGVLVCGVAGDASNPALARDGSGGVIVVWSDHRSGDRLYAHVVESDGTLAAGIPADGRQIPSSSAGDTFSDLASDGQGGCFVARGVSASSYLHRLDAAMQPRPGWPAEGITLNTLPSPGGAAGVSPDGLGGAYVWFRNGFGNVAPQGLYAQHFAADGTAPGWVPGGYRLSGTGQATAIARSGSGAIIAWDDTRNSYRGVYAQRVLIDGPVATQLALVSASARPGRVSLRWYSADGPALSATLERSADGADWAFLAEITADGTGNLAYEDAAVTPGARYGYRIVWRDGETLHTGGETWITVPKELALALGAPSPNPSNGAVTLAVTLPEARGARLDVLDLAGRRVAGRDLGGLEPGRHVIALTEVEALAPGLYVLQLTQAGVARRARLVRVK